MQIGEAMKAALFTTPEAGNDPRRVTLSRHLCDESPVNFAPLRVKYRKLS
jgi:hypothetical protein